MPEPMTPERLAEIRRRVENYPWGDPKSNPARDRRELLAEVDRLLRWKSEALDVLTAWEAVWVASGEPGRLGGSKARATADEVVRLQAQVAAVEKVRDKYKQNMKRLASLMTLSYCDPYEVNRTAVRDLDAALASGNEKTK